uniref:Large ribosomal subunit protein bL20c n=1 Tax=Pleurastrum terricola TaxID=34116 RepID=RK20_PLETE|nr:ribosomal protein L20 [Pleurastrum terricola]A6YGA1.1 RecName: Full=Large ribosomal subunit protein bL20c; AltName: Full=50S ribosomal protein L20, chloroplastic [Pleurastrum terricola]ABO69317.1 ribosomal protein L20 [Pleurastrum terricola]
MTRVKRGNVARKRRKKILKITKGFRGSSSTLFRTANQQQMKALRYSYRDRLTRKRNFRALWIVRINAMARHLGLNYNQFINNITKAQIIINRKTLSQLAIYDSTIFSSLISIKNN